MLSPSAFDSQDCASHGCPNEAEPGVELCRYCTTAAATPPQLRPGALAHLMDDDEDTSQPFVRGVTADDIEADLADALPPKPKEANIATCKIDGCPNESAGKGGSWHGLCSPHISEEGRRRQALRHTNPKAVKPPPGRWTAAADISAADIAAARTASGLRAARERDTRPTRPSSRGRCRRSRVRAQPARQRHPRTPPSARGSLT